MIRFAANVAGTMAISETALTDNDAARFEKLAFDLIHLCNGENKTASDKAAVSDGMNGLARRKLEFPGFNGNAFALFDLHIAAWIDL